MLQLNHISKEYNAGSFVQKALNDVSLCFRDNEFVSVLGPSGSGKTTLLNIIGGLDRYDTGDLLINSVSTNEYSDRDWDSYRNHTVGFVFQSYNLIPHQSVLSNVEMALTISGVSAKERERKAKRALDKVGLKDHIYKKPSQLSGGQMQRVAIARALVNDPDILLADEPTGALDSETSVQVMDLLKEVASDRLVVMVTHNPELALQYSTRIVELKDGRIVSDSDPYEPDVSNETIVKRNLGRASMSYFTALNLSFNNLWTKKARTILVSIAGSIGIIGIALILAMSTGADAYIKSVEEESLQGYPLEISNSSFSFEEMYLAGRNEAKAKSDGAPDTADVKELKTVTSLFSSVKSNDLKSLREYFESDDCDIYDYVQSIEYSYNLAPQVYFKYNDKYRRVNPDNSFSSLGFTSSESSSNTLLSQFSSTDSFYLMPNEPNLYKSQYEVKSGRWAENYNECVVVLTSTGKVTDMTLYAMGLKDPNELSDMVKKFSEGVSVETDDEERSYSYDDFIGVSFKVLPASEYYTYDKEYKVWTDRSSDDSFVNKKVESADDLTVVGVVAPTDSASSSALTTGINYLPSLIERMISVSAESDIVKAQLADPDVDVFSGKRFDDNKVKNDFDIASLFNVDEKALSKAFDFDADLSDFDLSSIDLSSLDFSDIDFGSAVNMDNLASMMPDMSEKDIEALFKNVSISISADQLESLFEELVSDFEKYIADSDIDYSAFPDAMRAYIFSSEAAEILSDDIEKYVDINLSELISDDDLRAAVENALSGYPDYIKKNSLVDDEPYSHIAEYLSSQEASALIDESLEVFRERLMTALPDNDQLGAIANDLYQGYEAYAEKNGYPTVSSLIKAFSDYVESDSVQKIITERVGEIIDAKKLEKDFSDYLNKIGKSLSKAMEASITSMTKAVADTLSSKMTLLSESLTSSIMKAFTFDPEKLTDMFSFDMNAQELKDLMASLLSADENSYEANLRRMGYADIDTPSLIMIYPVDYDGKSAVKDIIENYNTMMESRGEDDKVISYTDMVDALMSSVTDIVNAISYVLIAFVAISLVVSSIMIGVITYISVLERKKEIGILRALGASKRNISQVFNAETFIIGALAGIFGVVISYILIIPINAIIDALVEQAEIQAFLPVTAAVILVFLSIILTLIGGFIPSKKAAKKDPVIALRTE